MKAIIVYWSGTGNTKGMADAIAQGIEAAGSAAEVYAVDEFKGSVDGYDKILLGCPAMGAENLEEDEFQPFYEGIKASLAGKTVGLFGSYGWGDGEWMRNWVDDAKAAGANIINDEGFICQEDEDDIFGRCMQFGKDIA